MKLRPLLLSVLSFATGAGALICYRLGFDGPDRQPSKGDQAQAALRDGKAAGKQDHPLLAGSPSSFSIRAECLAFAGLHDRPTLDDIFKAAGIERPLRIGIFLQTATSDEIAALVTRGKKEWTYDTSLTDQIWLRWVEIDREAAFKADSGTAVWWAWAKLDPQAALAGAAANPRHLEEVIRSIGQGDQDAAIRLLSEHPAADTPLVWEGILNGISKTDRGAAAALALEKNVKLDEYVGKWVAWEPEAALTWARGLEDPVQRRRVMDLAVQELITADPRAAMAELKRLPAGRSRTERTAEAIAALSRTDPAAARTAAQALTNPGDRQRALSDLTETLAARDPKAALGILKGLSWAREKPGWTYESANRQSSGELSRGPAHQSIRQLMQVAPEATANALTALPPERNAPVDQAVRNWVAHQPEAASRWIRAMPAGSSKDTAINGLAGWLISENPEPDYEAALAWGATATSKEVQFSIMQSTFSFWKDRDWKAARAAVDRLAFTPEQRGQLLQEFNTSQENP